jgi:hypothetical protein
VLIYVVKLNCIKGFVSFIKEVTEMCRSEKPEGCQHPERLKTKPGECSAEQIQECHGQAVERPCLKEK